MISAAEMQAHLAQTRAFVAADVEEIVFEHTERVRNPATGGYKDVVTTSDLQRVRMIPQSDKVPQVVAPEGTREQPEYIVCGMPDAKFNKGDTFAWRGQTWRITQLHDKPDYIRKGDVILHNG